MHMIGNFDEIQKVSKDSMDVAVKSMGVFTKELPVAAATETPTSRSAPSRRAPRRWRACLVPVALDKVVEVQSATCAPPTKAYVSQATKVGEIMSGMAREAYKPYEGLFGKIAK
jgi:hypothetical protein